MEQKSKMVFNGKRIYYIVIILILSCNKNIVNNKITDYDISHELLQKNSLIVEMIHPIDYYKNEIIKYQDNFYGFSNVSMAITDLMNISQITKVDNLIPDKLVFFVSWFNQKGYVYILYTFNNNQELINHYYCGDFNTFENYKVIMDKLTGNKLEYGSVSIGDFNNDGKNEIAVYSYYKNIGNVFWVHGYNENKKDMEDLCVVPVFITHYEPFPSVEHIENGFRILEVIDEYNLELSWNDYIWDKKTGRYIK